MVILILFKLKQNVLKLIFLLKEQWEKALAYAPSVSYEYWRDVAKRYADHLSEQDDDEQAANYYLLSQEITKVKRSF